MSEKQTGSALQSVQIARSERGRVTLLFDRVIVEAPLTIMVNGALVTTLYCTPLDLEDLVCGYLWANALIQKIDADLLDALRVDPKAGTVDLHLGSPATQNPGKTTKIARSPIALDWRTISRASAELLSANPVFKETGAAHGAGLWTGDAFAVLREDVGRHNAVDKIGGAILRGRLDTKDAVLYVTGRVSADLVAKCAVFGIDTLVSRGAPTSLAVSMAKDSGLTLAGFSRGERMNIYSDQNAR